MKHIKTEYENTTMPNLGEGGTMPKKGRFCVTVINLSLKYII